MTDRGPTRALFTALNAALKVWLRDMRARRQGRRAVGMRRAAAAAAVTLAAGVTAGPAVAAVAPGGANQDATTVAAQGTQLAQRGMRPGPQPPMNPPLQVPRNLPNPQRQQPIPAPRPRPGVLDPATQEQVDRAEDLRTNADRWMQQRDWTNNVDEQNEAIAKQRREFDALQVPGLPPINPPVVNPFAPPALTQQEVDALNKALDSREPPGYVNQYPEFSLAPESELSRHLQKFNVDREIDQSYVNDPINAPHNESLLNDTRNRLHNAIDAVHDAKTEQDKQAARDQFNDAANDFNAAELGERDTYDGHPGERQVPHHMSDLPTNNDEDTPVNAVDEGLRPDQQQSPAEDAADPDGPQDPPSDTEHQMDSPRSRAQHDPDYDGPVDAEPPAAPAAPDAPADPGPDQNSESLSDDPNAGPVASEDADTISGADGMDSLGSYDGTDNLGTDGLGTDGLGPDGAIAGYAGSDTISGAVGTDNLGSISDTDSLGSDSLGSDSIGATASSDATGGFGDADSSGGFGGDSGDSGGDSGMGGDTAGMGGDTSSGMGGDSAGGMGSDSSSGMGGDSSGMGGDSSGGMGGGGMSSGGDSSGGGMGSGGMGGGDGGF